MNYWSNLMGLDKRINDMRSFEGMFMVVAGYCELPALVFQTDLAIRR